MSRSAWDALESDGAVTVGAAHQVKATQEDGYGLGLALGSPVTLEQAKALHVKTVLAELGGNLSQAAIVLAVDRRTLYRMIQRWGFVR